MTNAVYSRERTGHLSRARYVLCHRNAGLPTGGDPYGNGALVVVRGRESRPHGEGGQVVSTEYSREVLRMRNAETVLNVIRERGERGLPLENIYRLLYNRNLYLRAYVASTQTRELRPRASPQRPWTVCHWRKSTASSKPCATSGSGGPAAVLPLPLLLLVFPGPGL